MTATRTVTATRTGTATRTETAGRGGRAVPLYVHPAVDPAAWRGLVGARLGDGFVVVNVADGPGERCDAVVDSAVAGLLAGGQPVVGYVDAGYGARSVEDVVDDARRWWALYGVEGVFLDRVPSGAAAGDGDLVAARVGPLRAAGAPRVVLNPGTRTSPEVAALGDVVVVFEGPWTEHARACSTAAERPTGLPAPRVAHLVHSVPPGVAPGEVVRAARRAGAGVVGMSRLHLPNPWAEVDAGRLP